MRDAALEELRAWQRAYEWQLAREVHAKTQAVGMVRRHTHDLFDHIQIVELASLELERRAKDQAELVADITGAANALKDIVKKLVAGLTSNPTPVPPASPLVPCDDIGGACRSAFARASCAFPPRALELDLQSTFGRVACSPDDLEHLVVGVVLEAITAPRVVLLVRSRAIDGMPWLELVRTTSPAVPGDAHELAVVEAIAARAGGEVSRGETRDGGDEFVVALPCTP